VVGVGVALAASVAVRVGVLVTVGVLWLSCCMSKNRMMTLLNILVKDAPPRDMMSKSQVDHINMNTIQSLMIRANSEKRY
jgi:hypothetical protein